MDVEKLKTYIEKTKEEIINKTKDFKKEHQEEIDKAIQKGKDIKNKAYKKIQEFKNKSNLD